MCLTIEENQGEMSHYVNVLQEYLHKYKFEMKKILTQMEQISNKMY